MILMMMMMILMGMIILMVMMIFKIKKKKKDDDIYLESCSKNCRDLLSNVSHRHPFHISTLLRVLADRVQHVEKLAIYLFRELPFAVWRPTKVRSIIRKSAKQQSSF